MKSFYEFVQLLKENDQGTIDNHLKTGEERRRHFGVQGTGGGRTDDAVIYNNLEVDYSGDSSGEMFVWFEDSNDLESTIDDANEIVFGYGKVSGSWDFNYAFTVRLSENPSKRYQAGDNGLPMGLPNSHGSGIVAIEITDLERYKDRDYDRDYDRDNYNSDPDGHKYWDRYWSTGPGRDH